MNTSRGAFICIGFGSALGLVQIVGACGTSSPAMNANKAPCNCEPDGGAGNDGGDAGNNGDAGDGGPIDTTSDPANCGAIGHNCLGGACIASACQPVILAHAAAFPISEIIIRNQEVFYGDIGIMSVSLDGGAPVTLVPHIEPNHLAANDTTVYWAASQELADVPQAGGAEVPGPGYSESGHVFVAASPTAVYWASDNGAAIWTIPLSSFMATATPTAFNSSPAAAAVTGLVADSSNLYWMGATGNFKQPLQGGAATMLSGPSGNAANPTVLIAVNSVNLYFGTPRDVDAVPLAGGATKVLVNGANPASLAVDETYVYWTSFYDSNVYRQSLKGGPTLTVAHGKSPQALAVDDQRVVWRDWAPTGSGVVIMMVAK